MDDRTVGPAKIQGPFSSECEEKVGEATRYQALEVMMSGLGEGSQLPSLTPLLSLFFGGLCRCMPMQGPRWRGRCMLPVAAEERTT